MGPTRGIIARNNQISLQVWRSVTASELELESGKMALEEAQLSEASPYDSPQWFTFSQMMSGTAPSFSVLYTATY